MAHYLLGYITGCFVTISAMYLGYKEAQFKDGENEWRDL